MFSIDLAKLQTIFVYGLILMLCSYQVIDILQKYLSFETWISIDYYNSSHISLPGITVCFNKQNLIGDIQLNETVKNNRSLLHQYMNREFTIKEQNLFLESKEILKNNCRAIKTMAFEKTNESKHNYIDCGVVSPINESINSYYKCFALFSQLIGESDRKFTIDYSIRTFTDSIFEMVRIAVPKHFSSALIYMHPRDEPVLRYGETNNIYVDFVDFTAPYIVYKKTVVKSLPRPFRTDCFDYKSKGLGSRYVCISICRRNLIVERMNLWPVFYYATNLSSDLKLMDVLGNLNHTLDNEIGHICEAKCGNKLECRQEIYEMKKDRWQSDVDDRLLPWTAINIMPPVVPDQMVRYVQKMSLIETICFVGSLISLYFGVSVLMLSDIASIAVRSLHKKISVVISNAIAMRSESTNINHLNVNINVKIHPIID